MTIQEKPRRVLLIDDEITRLHQMKRLGILTEDVVFAYDPFRGFDLLQDGHWDQVFLDHDLSAIAYRPYPFEDPDDVGDYPHPVTGKDLVRALLASPPYPASVIVHSTNIRGSTKMVRALRQAGIHTIQLPYGDVLVGGANGLAKADPNDESYFWE